MPTIPKPDKAKMVTLTKFALRSQAETFAITEICHFFQIEGNKTRIFLSSGQTVDINKTASQLTTILEDLGWQFQDL